MPKRAPPADDFASVLCLSPVARLPANAPCPAGHCRLVSMPDSVAPGGQPACRRASHFPQRACGHQHEYSSCSSTNTTLAIANAVAEPRFAPTAPAPAPGMAIRQQLSGPATPGASPTACAAHIPPSVHQSSSTGPDQMGLRAQFDGRGDAATANSTPQTYPALHLAPTPISSPTAPSNSSALTGAIELYSSFSPLDKSRSTKTLGKSHLHLTRYNPFQPRPFSPKRHRNTSASPANESDPIINGSPSIGSGNGDVNQSSGTSPERISAKAAGRPSASLVNGSPRPTDDSLSHINGELLQSREPTSASSTTDVAAAHHYLQQQHHQQQQEHINHNGLVQTQDDHTREQQQLQVQQPQASLIERHRMEVDESNVADNTIDLTRTDEPSSPPPRVRNLRSRSVAAEPTSSVNNLNNINASDDIIVLSSDSDSEDDANGDFEIVYMRSLSGSGPGEEGSATANDTSATARRNRSSRRGRLQSVDDDPGSRVRRASPRRRIAPNSSSEVMVPDVVEVPSDANSNYNGGRSAPVVHHHVVHHGGHLIRRLFSAIAAVPTAGPMSSLGLTRDNARPPARQRVRAPAHTIAPSRRSPRTRRASSSPTTSTMPSVSPSAPSATSESVVHGAGSSESQAPITFSAASPVVSDPPRSPGSVAAFKCSVCLDIPGPEVALSATVCGHVFCDSCITAWIKKQKKCPICRKALTGKNSVHRLFLTE